MKTALKLSQMFSQVSSDYQHYPKMIRPGPALVTSDVYLKWHFIYPESLPISEEQISEAQIFLREEMSGGRLELKDEVGFVAQHRTAAFLILYVCTWRGNNEVWETLYHKPIPGGGYGVFQRQDTSPTFCVWVMAAVTHEQKAWTRYLRSERDEGAREAYLQDQLTDLIW